MKMSTALALFDGYVKTKWIGLWFGFFIFIFIFLKFWVPKCHLSPCSWLSNLLIAYVKIEFRHILNLSYLNL